MGMPIGAGGYQAQGAGYYPQLGNLSGVGGASGYGQQQFGGYGQRGGYQQFGGYGQRGGYQQYGQFAGNPQQGGPGQFGGAGQRRFGGPGGPGGMQPRSISQMSQGLVQRLDANGDGSIDLATEGARDQRLLAHLQAADTDGSGTVTAAELQAEMQSHDTNGDGYLSFSEIRGAVTAAKTAVADATTDATATDTVETVPVDTTTADEEPPVAPTVDDTSTEGSVV